MTNDLQPDEIRPTLDLSPEEIAALEQEKRELRGMASATRKSDTRRISGHGTALEADEYTPKVVRLAANKYDRPKPEVKEQDSMASLDPEVLGALAREAKTLEAEARDAEEVAQSSRVAANNARVRLNDYMREHGLA